MKKYIVEVEEGNITICVPFDSEKKALGFAAAVQKDGCLATIRGEKGGN